MTFPWLMAAMTLTIPCGISATLRMGGKSKNTTRSLPGGIRRSSQRRKAWVSPARASSMALRVSCAASPASKVSIVEGFTHEEMISACNK